MSTKQKLALEYGNKVRFARMIDFHLSRSLRTKKWNGLVSELKRLRKIYQSKLHITNEPVKH